MTRAPCPSAQSSSAIGAVRIEERDVRRGEDAVRVVELPVVEHPRVEGVERRVRGLGIVDERLLHADAERGEQEAAFDPLLVHQRDPRRGLAVRRVDRLELAERGANVVAGALAAEVLVERAGSGDGVEGRVRDEPVHPSGHQETLLPVDLGPLHRALGHAGIEVPGERVRGLVVVVVRVEELEVDRHEADGSRTGETRSTGWRGPCSTRGSARRGAGSDRRTRSRWPTCA